jgi:hypothetical protein
MPGFKGQYVLYFIIIVKCIIRTVGPRLGMPGFKGRHVLYFITIIKMYYYKDRRSWELNARF